MMYSGDSLGKVTIIEPSTAEHVSVQTIHDPITAIAPASDCRTYAIGYLPRTHIQCAQAWLTCA